MFYSVAFELLEVSVELYLVPLEGKEKQKINVCFNNSFNQTRASWLS